MTDLQRRILFTLGALAVYRLGAHIPMPGIDSDLFLALFTDGNHLLLRTFPWATTSVLQGVSIFALGIGPYLTAALLVRLAPVVFKRLREMEHGSPAEQRKVALATRILALLFAALHAYGLAKGLEFFGEFSGRIVPTPGSAFRAGAVVTLTGGLAALMWLADQITRRGIGNGIALILFAEIVADLPRILASFFELTRTGAISFVTLISLMLLAVLVVSFIVFMERAVPFAILRCPQQVVGSRTFAARQATIPLRINNGGLVSAVLASLLLSILLSTINAFSSYSSATAFSPLGWYGHPVHIAGLAALIVATTYLYSLRVVDPKSAAKYLERKGASVPGALPGHETERALRQQLFRLALIGGGFLALVYLLPEMLHGVLPQLPGAIGGAGILIAVAVALDTLCEGAHRLQRDRGGTPPSEALAIAMELPDQRKISEAGR